MVTVRGRTVATTYDLAIRVLLGLSIIGLLLGVAAFLTFTRPQSLAKRLLAVLLVLTAGRELSVVAYFDPDLLLRPLPPNWFGYWNDLQILVYLASAAFLYAYPARPALRSWHTPIFGASFALLLAGAYFWTFDRGLLITGWPERTGAWTIWYRLLIRDTGPGVALVAMIASSMGRAARLGPEPARTAYAFLPLLFGPAFASFGWYLRSVTRYAAGESDFLLTYLSQVPGDCCHITRAVSELQAGFFLLALYLAVRKRSFVALSIILGAFALTWILVLGPFDYTIVWFLVPPIGTLYVIRRYGAFGGPNVALWVQNVFALFVLVSVFLAVTSFVFTVWSDPFAQVLSVLLGLSAGVLLALLVHPQAAGRLLPGVPGDADDTRRRVGAYRTALASALATGADADTLSLQLRPLRAQLGITDREHAILEYTLRAASQPSLSATAPARPGQLLLNRYRVVRALGAGGAGATLLCQDEEVGRTVVVKQLRARDSSGDGLQEVLHEGRAMAALQHPNVVTLFDVERVGEEAFLVMEHLEGGSLADRLARGPVSPGEFRRLADDLLRGLEAVHGAGLVHRDVKPANVLFTRDGRAKVGDFGVAHVPGFETTVVPGGGTEGAVGTIRFMSPEQARGRTVDARSDLYGAAATLFEAWTGRAWLPPRPNETAVELQMRASAPRRRGPTGGLPGGLGPWFDRALRPRATERFESAAQMRDALPAALAGLGGDEAGRSASAAAAPGVAARVSPRGTRVGSVQRRRRRPAGAAPLRPSRDAAS